MTDLSRAIAIKPIIQYPHEAQIGKTYLMTIDLQPEEGFEWQYEEEEYPIYCIVDSKLFSSKPVGEPVIVLHRFGGNYGEAAFLLAAAREGIEREFQVRLINRWGLLVKTLNLQDVRVGNKLIQTDGEKELDYNQELELENQDLSTTEDDQNDKDNTLWDRMPGWDENDTWENPQESYLGGGYSLPQNIEDGKTQHHRQNQTKTENSGSDSDSLREAEEHPKRLPRASRHVDWNELWNKMPDWDE